IQKTHQTQYYQGFSLPKITFIGLNSGLRKSGSSRMVRTTALQYLPNQANEPVPNTTGSNA
ncbi:MAG: hypothetical protein ACP5I8_16565, partial [Phycisphaerae bacterium]